MGPGRHSQQPADPRRRDACRNAARGVKHLAGILNWPIIGIFISRETCLVIPPHEFLANHTHPQPPVYLGADLHLVAQVSDHPGDRQGGVVGVPGHSHDHVLQPARPPGVEALCPHPARDRPGVSSQAGDGHSHMVVYGQDLLLVAGGVVSGEMGITLWSSYHG